VSTPTPAAPVNVFVAADGNGFMRDIASWITEAAASTGRPTRLVDDRLPTPDGSLSLVVAPHEFFELFDAPAAELQRAAAASVCVCTEQPGTPWFHLSVDVCRRGLHTLDINPHGVEALRAVGVNATRLQLGAVPSIDVAARGGPRPIDVLFMGGLDDRRGAVLAQLAPRLVHRRSELRLFRFDRPVTSHTPGLVFGAAKYDLLASAAVLINIHRDRAAHHPPGLEPPAYFEWARLIEAMANGCVVVTEPAEGHEPLQPGIHFVTAEADELGDVVDALFNDPDRRSSIAEAAHHAVTVELDLAATIAPILDQLERDVTPMVADHVRHSVPTRGLWRLGSTRVPPPVRLGAFRPYLDLQTRAKQLALADGRMLRRLDAAACILRHGTHQHIERIETPAYAAAEPEVSVIVTVYNYADVVLETLESIVASADVDYEVIVVDDHATDHSRQVVRGFLTEHPGVPMLLLGNDVNEGLAAARNAGFAAARGEFVMVMDADNHVYPTCLRRLADTLHTTPGAAAAYGILEDFGDQHNVRSALAWDVERLCQANYIDAQAMWRRTEWCDLGGYCADDERLFGWEDWDLWLRLAASGGRATLRPEILGRYRVRRGSMIALTNLATDEALAAMHRRHPELPWQPAVP
jgi:hypothetical protein